MWVLILSVILTIIMNGIYHKIFNVVYFSFKALIVEWFVCYAINMAIIGSFL